MFDVREGLIGLVQFLGVIAVITAVILLVFWIFNTFGTGPTIVAGCIIGAATIFISSAIT